MSTRKTEILELLQNTQKELSGKALAWAAEIGPHGWPKELQAAMALHDVIGMGITDLGDTTPKDEFYSGEAMEAAIERLLELPVSEAREDQLGWVRAMPSRADVEAAACWDRLAGPLQPVELSLDGETWYPAFEAQDRGADLEALASELLRTDLADGLMGTPEVRRSDTDAISATEDAAAA